MRRLRVLMFSLQPRGGFHHYTTHLCNALVQHPRIESVRYLIAYREQEAFGVGSEEHEIVAPSVQLAYLAPEGRIDPIRKYLGFLRNLVHEMRRLHQGAYDVFHVQTGTHHHLLNLLLLAWCKIAQVPIVRTVHEVNLAERGKGASLLGLWFSMLELKIADHVILHDTAMRNRARNELGLAEHSVSVVPHGNYLGFRRYLPASIDDGLAVSAASARRGDGVGEGAYAAWAPQSPVVLFFGVKRHKGLEVFLQAWRMLQAEGHPFKALLVGTVSTESADLVEEARRLPHVEVHTGYIPNSEVWRCFCRSTVVVMPYLAGTTSGAVHLAFAFKRPVIASDLDCFKEMVIPGKTGLVIPKGDSVALKEAMAQLAKDPERCREMGEAGFRLESSTRYRWETIAQQTVAVYGQARKLP